MTGSYCSKLALACVVVLVLWANTPCDAITAGEKAAILQLLDNYPLLSNASSPNIGYAVWDPNQVDNICSVTRPFYGVQCSAGSIISVRMCAAVFSRSVFVYLSQCGSFPSPHFIHSSDACADPLAICSETITGAFLFAINSAHFQACSRS